MWALDGKTVRGARTGESGQAHLVSILDQASGVVSAQVATEARTGEVAAVPALLAGLDLRGSWSPPMPCTPQLSHARHLHERAGPYVMTVKANQPTLLGRLRVVVEPIGAAARERGRGHGRVETRTISVVNLHPCPDLDGEFFPHAAQAIKLIRRRRPLRPGGQWKR